MGKYGRKPISFQLADYQHGTNTVLKASDVGKRYRSRYPRKQCVDCLDIMLNNNKRRPPLSAYNAAVPGRIRGLHVYTQNDGTERHLVVVETVLYKVNTDTGVLTQLYDFGGTAGEAWFFDYLNVCFVCNGTKMIKVEGDTAYQVGINEPAANTVSAVAGGSLAVGAWSVYVVYARDDGAGNVLLYSRSPDTAGTATTSGGDLSLQITIPNSSDPQVNNKIVFAKGPSDTAWVYYGETGDNLTTTITITSDANRDGDKVYSVLAATNYVPGAIEYLHVHDKRLIGNVGNTIFYSLQEGVVYDLERFDTSANFLILPFDVQGFFTIGRHLFVNTPNGLIKIPYGDFNQQWERVGAINDNPHYFKYFRTVDTLDSNRVIGFTQNGCRTFDGEQWSRWDITKDIKPDFKKMIQGAGTYNQPCGLVVTRDNRTEYIVSFRDLTVSSVMNNIRWVLNVDGYEVFQENNFIAPWEKWGVGCNYMAIDKNNNVYYAQQQETLSTLSTETTGNMKDLNVYIGDLLLSENLTKPMIQSGDIIPDMEAKVRLQTLRTLAKHSNSFDVQIQMISGSTQSVANNVPTRYSQFRLDVSRLGVDRLYNNTPVPKKIKLKRKLEDYGFYIIISQLTQEDRFFELMELNLYGQLIKGRLI